MDKNNKENSDYQGNELDNLSNKLDDKFSDMQDENSFLDEINSSLAEQITKEMEGNKTYTNDIETNKRFPKGLKIFAIAFSVIMLIMAFLMFTGPGRSVIFNIAGKYIHGKLDYEKPNNQQGNNQDNDNKVIEKEKDKTTEHVVNILLIGVEEIQGASNTDLMIIASMNTKDKTMKLTSLMRDLYVEIPGYSNNRLNSAYAKGGIDLLYDTIEKNFNITMDGYALVNFSAFEDIVDMVDGVEVTLTRKEADYLNTTNYISNPANRKVVEGTQVMNGNQALGYCRVRKVSTATESNDFGRTQRQRAVLNAIFKKLKSKNILQLGLLMNDILSNVKIKTDISEKNLSKYLEEAVSLNIKELDQLRIPSDGSFKNSKVRIGSTNQDVLEIKDWFATREEIRMFIYGNSTNSVVQD